MPSTSDKKAKVDNDLQMIINSINKFRRKYPSKSFKSSVSTIDKKHLVFKIVDNCDVSPTKAKEYLDILESRGIIEIDKQIIYVLDEKKEEVQLTKEEEAILG